MHHSARLFCDLLRGQAAPAIAPALGDLVGLAVAWLRRKTLFGLRLALLSFLAQAVLALGAEATLGRRATHRRSAASAAAVHRPPSLPLPDNRLAADEAARLPRRGRPELDGGDTQPAVPLVLRAWVAVSGCSPVLRAARRSQPSCRTAQVDAIPDTAQPPARRELLVVLMRLLTAPAPPAPPPAELWHVSVAGDAQAALAGVVLWQRRT